MHMALGGDAQGGVVGCTCILCIPPGYATASGFWPRVRARALRAPVFLSYLTHKQGRCASPPPIAASLLLIYTSKHSLRPELGPSGGGCVYLSFGLSCTLLSYIASY